MNGLTIALTVIGFTLFGSIVVYLIVRLVSAAWHRSKLEAEAELAAIRAESLQRKEQDND